MHWPSKSTTIGIRLSAFMVFIIKTALAVGDVVVSGWEGDVTSGEAVVSAHEYLSHGQPPIQFS